MSNSKEITTWDIYKMMENAEDGCWDLVELVGFLEMAGVPLSLDARRLGVALGVLTD